ncbi:response regulator [Mycolicibacterium goodii]|uniref:response regulator n=1 Tax=Mycolicibacterium goodii TaxID=134601 RepID=UPI001BDC63FA|nr:response regulator transcription factor [Mycolicibacterium goodii]MBU8829773.1 response regulator transcription factor [Mycolicibacterium goodii]
MTIRIVLADDHGMFRSGLRAIIETQPDFACIADVADGRAAVTEIARLRPDVAVLDVRMPKLDGIAVTQQALADPANRTWVLVLTTFDTDQYVYRALAAGASGFLLKSLPPEELVTAIRIAARGDALVDPSVTRRLVARFTASLAPAESSASTSLLAKLTPREREVFTLVAAGLSNSEIAQQLFIGDETVKTHVSRILVKLDLRDRVHAVVFAHRHGLAT